MAKHNYLVSVFVDGKNENSYFSENLDDLVTIKAVHKDCEISIFDLTTFTRMSMAQVEIEIKKSGERWKKSKFMVAAVPKRTEQKKKVAKAKKCGWERPVRCVETGQVFRSIRDCCEKTGIPYMTIVNCIKNKNATRGVHFANVAT